MVTIEARDEAAATALMEEFVAWLKDSADSFVSYAVQTGSADDETTATLVDKYGDFTAYVLEADE
jgi:hypothetical protein